MHIQLNNYCSVLHTAIYAITHIIFIREHIQHESHATRVITNILQQKHFTCFACKVCNISITVKVNKLSKYGTCIFST